LENHHSSQLTNVAIDCNTLADVINAPNIQHAVDRSNALDRDARHASRAGADQR
jgi:hypothetical protein